MSLKELQCLSVCDYPLKQTAYEKLLKSLGFSSIHPLNRLTEIRSMSGCSFEFILIDWNIPPPMEPGFMMFFSLLFPHSTIVMMEEDHERVELEEGEQRVIAKLGKRADLEMLHELMAQLTQNLRNQAMPCRIKKQGDKPPVSVAYAMASAWVPQRGTQAWT